MIRALRGWLQALAQHRAAGMTRAAKSYIRVEVGQEPPGTVDITIDGHVYAKRNGLPITVGGGKHLIGAPGSEPRLIEVLGTKERPMEVRF